MKTESTPAATEGAEAVPEDGIGDRIRSARDARGLSQTALATRTKMVDPAGKGVARTVLVGYESGNFRPGAREIRLICQALSITPNWLILGDELATSQASMETVRGRDWTNAVRLAMAVCILKPHERAAFQSLVLSMAGRQLGDLNLSRLLYIGLAVARDTMPKLKEWMGDDAEGKSLEDLVNGINLDDFSTNWGNKLLLDEEQGDVIGGEWLYQEPGKVAK